VQRHEFDAVFFGEDPLLEYASDCPVRYEVWLAYALDEPHDPAEEAAGARHDVMIKVDADADADLVTDGLIEALAAAGITEEALVASAGDFIAVSLTFPELVQHVIGLTSLAPLLRALRAACADDALLRRIVEGESLPVDQQIRGRTAARNRYTEAWDRLIWLARLMIATDLRARHVSRAQAAGSLRRLLGPPEPSRREPASEVLRIAAEEEPAPGIAAITVNRQARSSVRDSRRTVKADAATALFGVSCASITWAVLDSGIDATHPAFLERDADGELPAELVAGPFRSRVTATYDFTRFRQKLALQGGKRPDWVALERELRIPHEWEPDGSGYQIPEDEHGTHVAGILGGNWPEEDVVGVCPDIRLWDLRVLDADGLGNEFNILAALQFLRWFNDRSSRQTVAGANLSLALAHEVANYSCGWTPVCVECDRLVRSGVVVVTVAGNAAFDPLNTSGLADGTSYRAISITDPGNADSVITVGATHRTDPHRHGVSHFSGRGPTADGRVKPDLLAPGERIDGPVPDDGIRRMSGTSQAAPHVSGAAALLIGRYRELLGRPERIKQVLCDTATDLGRAPTFQGHGMLDVLRAMQSL
jgi:subtilisin family serine protease